MILFVEDGKTLAMEIEELVGIECFYKKRNQSKDNHFVIDDITDENIFADNRIHQSITNVQLTLFTKSPYDGRKYNSIIKSQFNCDAKYTFETEYEWYQTIYEFQVIYGS